MRSPFLLVALVTASLGGLCQNAKTYDSTDLAALNTLPVRWQQYWNHHDMDSMGTMLRNDVDFVNVAGVWLKGKQATINDHMRKHKGIMFKNSMWKTERVDIKYVKPDLAILHVSWGLTGDNDADGTPRPPRHGIFTWVVSKEDQWQVLAAANVNIREPVIPTK